jgi:hypothetical protein
MHQVQILSGARSRLSGKISRQVPANWNELSRRQLVRVSAILFAGPSGAHAPRGIHWVKLQLLRILFRIPHSLFNRFGAERLAALLWLTDFLLQENLLTRNVLPTIWIRKWKCPVQKLYGPGDNLKGVIYDEFAYAEIQYLQYAQAKDPVALDKLVAALYRPKRKDYGPHSPHYQGDIREDFNSYLVEGRAKRLASLPMGQKLAILLYYQGCRNQLIAAHDKIFSSDESNKPVKHPWLQMIRHVPSDKFGPIDQIERQRVHKVLFHLNEMMRENQEAVAAANRLRNEPTT